MIGPDVVPLAALHPAATGIESLVVAWPSNEKLLGAAVDDFVASRADQSGSSGQHYGRYLRGGDVMESTITGLGAQRSRCVRP